MGEEQAERFTVWSTRIVGIIGLAVLAAFAVLGATGTDGGYHPAAYAICGLIAMLLWVAVLRPAVAVEGDRLVLRNPVSVVRIPLAAVERVAVRQWLAVGVGEHRYTNAGISRTRRQGVRDDQRGGATGEEVSSLSYGGLVERRIQKLAADARDRQGIKLYSEEQEALAADVRRDWAWPEIAGLALLSVAVVITLFV